MDNLGSILKKLSVSEQEQLTGLINKQQKKIALHRELIKQINQEMALSKVVLNAAGDGILAVDENHKILDLNPALANMFGYTIHELKGQDLNVLLPEETRINHQGFMQKFAEKPQALIAGDQIGDSYYGMHKTKGPIKISIAISHGVKGKQKVYAGIVRDLTSQTQLEQENERKTAELINRTKELEGLYTLRKLSGEESIPDIINKLFTEIVPKATRYPDKAITIIELDGQTYRSRKEKPLVALTSKLHNGTLTFGFLAGVFYGTEKHQKLLDTFTGELDKAILQVKAGQRELQTERRAAMGQLSTGIAHNVNNGLQIIQGYAQMALDLAATEEMKEPLRRIKIKTHELGANVRGILQSSNYKPGNNHFEVFDLGELISDYLTGAENPFKSEALLQGATVAINKQIGVDTCISGMKGEITLITQALIKNSVESFLGDGSIDIDVSRNGEFVHLQVKDTGIGMNKETQEKLFEPFFTTKGFEPGKGLSLGTAQKIAQEHGGEISLLNSQIGLGTTIELKLPYAQQQTQRIEKTGKIRTTGKTEIQECENRHLNILWAEDDEIIQETVKMMTRTLDDRIVFAGNGKIALDMLQKEHYDVLVTDIGMPIMGGWKLLKSIKGLYKNMPRVISSGYVINTTDMSASGASYLMNKPLDKNSVIKILDNLKSHMPPLATDCCKWWHMAF